MKYLLLFLFFLTPYVSTGSGEQVQNWNVNSTPNRGSTDSAEFVESARRNSTEFETTMRENNPQAYDTASTKTEQADATTDQIAEQNGLNPTNVIMGAGAVKGLASLALDAEDAQKLNGLIDVGTGIYLTTTSCTAPNINWFQCIYGASAIANGYSSFKASKKSKKAGEALGGDRGGATAGGDGPDCNPLDTNCLRIYCNSHPNLCPTCSNGSLCPNLNCSECPSDSTCSPACTGGQVCQNGTCTDPSDNTCSPACTGGQVCQNGTCTDPSDNTCSPACTGGQVCQNGTCTDPSDNTCSPACTGGQVCQNGTCTDPSNNNTCPDGSTCPASGVCLDSSTCTPDCPEGKTWNGSECASTGEVSCEEDNTQPKCDLGDDDDEDPCIPLTGQSCDDTIKEACTQMEPQCRITPPDNIPMFYDPEGNPIQHGSPYNLGLQLGMTPDEIEQAQKEIEAAQKKAMNQLGASSGGSKRKLKGGGFSPAGSDSALSADSSTEAFKPSLTNGGGGSHSNNRNARKRRGSAFSRQLQSLMDKNKKGHRASVKKHGYKPTKLGNQPIGTAHDNIFDMMSRGYQSRENSLNAR